MIDVSIRYDLCMLNVIPILAKRALLLSRDPRRIDSYSFHFHIYLYFFPTSRTEVSLAREKHTHGNRFPFTRKSERELYTMDIFVSI